MRFVFAILAALTMSACSTTSVEVVPAAATEQCPADVRGGFIGVEPETTGDAAFGVFVDDACDVLVFDRDKDPRAKPIAVDVRWLDRYAFAEVADLAALKPSGPKSEGWLVAGWSRDEDRVSIRQLDHRRIATLIVNGALEGETEWSGDYGHNRLAAFDDVAQKMDLFAGTAPATLRYVGKKRESLEAALAKAQSK